MNAADASAKAQELSALRQLRDNPAWQKLLAPKIREAREQHLLGISDRASGPDSRAQHLEAYHLAKELDEWLPARLELLERELQEFVQANDVVDTRLIDSLGS